MNEEEVSRPAAIVQNPRLLAASRARTRRAPAAIIGNLMPGAAKEATDDATWHLPLAAFPTLRESNPASAELCLKAWHPKLTGLRSREPRRPFFYNSNAIDLRKLRLVARHSSAMVLEDDESRNIVNVTLRGQVEFDMGERVVSGDVETAEIGSPNGEHIQLFSDGCISIMALFEPEVLLEHMQSFSGENMQGIRTTLPLDGNPWPAAPRTQAMLRGIMTNAVSMIDILSAHQAEHIMAARIEQAILHAAAIALNPSDERLLPVEQTTLDALHVGKAQEFIDAHAHRDITETDLALELDVPVRQLERAFLNVLGMLPRSAIKERRIELAYRDLSRGDPGARINDIAVRYGYRPSTFSALIERRYGEKASSILRRNRRMMLG